VKRNGILNGQLLSLMARLGHGDMIVITDRGFPFPHNGFTEVIDLGIIPNVPSFADVLFPLLEELEIEGYIYAQEMKKSNPRMAERIEQHPALNGKAMREQSVIPHPQFKQIVMGEDPSRGLLTGFIRTGEFTKYTNVILTCGVTFS
jgi:D-ribose pyranase